MPIAIICGSCEAKLNAPDAAAGNHVKCPKCATLLQIPLPEPEADIEVLDDEPKAKPKPPAKPKPVLLDEDEDDRPAPKKKSKPVVAVEDDEDEDPRPRKKGKGVKQPAAMSKLPLILGLGGEERDRVSTIKLQQWQGAPDAGKWHDKAELWLPAPAKLAPSGWPRERNGAEVKPPPRPGRLSSLEWHGQFPLPCGGLSWTKAMCGSVSISTGGTTLLPCSSH